MTRLFEGLEHGDLQRLVHNEMHIDEFKSKLGDDKDVIVVSFKVAGKDPAVDLVNFIEKGYDWIVDADVSSGEMDDGDYIVFIEVERNEHAPKQILKLMSDIVHITSQKLDDWRVRYYKDQTDHSLDLESLTNLIPLTPQAYEEKFGPKDNDGEEGSNELQSDIDSLKAAAGVKVTTKAPKNEFTESLRIAAGIK